MHNTNQAKAIGLLAANRIHFGFTPHPDEGFYGFGERFHGSLSSNQRGQKLYNWVEDGGFGFGTSLRLPKGLDSTYTPMPYFLSSRGYGMYLNTTFRTSFDVAKTDPNLVSFEV